MFENTRENLLFGTQTNYFDIGYPNKVRYKAVHSPLLSCSSNAASGPSVDEQFESLF